MSLFKGAKGFEINHFSVNNIARGATLTNNYGSVKYLSFATLHCSHESHPQSPIIEKLPRVEASYDDYACKKQSGPCFGRTRGGLINDIEEWSATGDRSQIYVLSGLAGIGKSTVAFTIADRAKTAGCLGASFFFSRDEAERSNAKRFFTTMAFQLCVYDDQFSRAIENVLREEHGIAATTKDPRDQLEVLILGPLRDIVRLRPQPVVLVVDALDECEDRDAVKVLAALMGLVQELPSFRVLLTTRPRPHLPTDASGHRKDFGSCSGEPRDHCRSFILRV